MLPAFAQLLSRASCRRCFSSRAVVSNDFAARPAPYSVRPVSRPSAYTGVSIPIPERDPDSSWNNPVGNAIVGDKKSPADIWRDQSRINVLRLRAHPPADTYQGRSVQVLDGEFAEASRELEKILARNRVRGTIRAGARHEKKGPKRRRIKSEQWRKHFAHQVRKNVQLVHKIRRRGV
ncbi:hypothetical protein B0H17DRAFT_245040 [Mycena rosella]|uniref:Uncharacterized protein n=1 Tax=Mycena rosella TaxID=1033263 RepID=A0AAD7H1D5_MYCRO|nr:hypothetical protein B0H17DRAFT_245040 [Mycena rosella]